MSLKAELEIWVAALAAYDAENFGEALDQFFRIADSAKIFANIGLIYATVGDHQSAVTQFEAAIQLDQYLAVAYFQCGVSNFVLGRYELSWQNFEEASTYLRGNQSINYEQLGLNFKLYSCEVLFNLGLSLIYLGRVEEGLRVLITASQDKVIDEHAVIDEAIHNRGKGYTVFSMPVGVLYRPSEIKVKNAKQKDYMGKAKLVATADSRDVDTEFAGVNRLRQDAAKPVVEDPKPPQSDLTRSITVPPPRVVADPIAPLQRSRTVLDLAPLRVRATPPIEPIQLVEPRFNEPREEDFLAPGRAGNAASDNLHVKSARTPVSQSPLPLPSSLKPSNSMYGSAPKLPSVSSGPSQAAQSINDYIDSYRNVESSHPPSSDSDAATSISMTSKSEGSRTREHPAHGSLHRKPTRSATSAGNSSSSRGSEPKRRHTRRKTNDHNHVTQKPNVHEEEEGYASGDHEDAPLAPLMTKIRVKVHYQGDIRGMALAPDTSYDSFMETLALKFGLKHNRLDVKFKDEDGGRVSLVDEMDYELALETSAVSVNGRTERRLEIWCSDN